MANKEMYDYLTSIVADHNYTLTVNPTQVVWEAGTKNIVVHQGDDGSEERVCLSDKSNFTIQLIFDPITREDAGTIYQFYYDSSYGNGLLYSFYLQHLKDEGHTYTVRFASHPRQKISGPSGSRFYGFESITFKVLGRKPE